MEQIDNNNERSGCLPIGSDTFPEESSLSSAEETFFPYDDVPYDDIDFDDVDDDDDDDDDHSELSQFSLVKEATNNNLELTKNTHNNNERSECLPIDYDTFPEESSSSSSAEETFLPYDDVPYDDVPYDDIILMMSMTMTMTTMTIIQNYINFLLLKKQQITILNLQKRPITTIKGANECLPIGYDTSSATSSSSNAVPDRTMEFKDETYFLVNNLGKDWKAFVRDLSVPTPEIEYQSQQNSQNIKEAVYGCLLYWFQKNAFNKTRKEVMDVWIKSLETIEREDLIHHFKVNFMEKPDNPVKDC